MRLDVNTIIIIKFRLVIPIRLSTIKGIYTVFWTPMVLRTIFKLVFISSCVRWSRIQANAASKREFEIQDMSMFIDISWCYNGSISKAIINLIIIWIIFRRIEKLVCRISIENVYFSERAFFSIRNTQIKSTELEALFALISIVLGLGIFCFGV